MALNTFKCNYVTSPHFKELKCDKTQENHHHHHHVLLRHVGSNTEHTKHNIRWQIHLLKHNLNTHKRRKQTKKTHKGTQEDTQYIHYSTVLANVSHTARFIVCWLTSIDDKPYRLQKATNLCDTKRDKKSSMQLSEVNSLFQYNSFRWWIK